MVKITLQYKNAYYLLCPILRLVSCPLNLLSFFLGGEGYVLGRPISPLGHWGPISLFLYPSPMQPPQSGQEGIYFRLFMGRGIASFPLRPLPHPWQALYLCSFSSTPSCPVSLQSYSLPSPMPFPSFASYCDPGLCCHLSLYYFCPLWE